MRVSKQVKFYGIVQGINFRRKTQLMASREGVSGWVRNLVDGSVEAVFSGEQDAVQRVLQFCLHDMSLAEVTSYEISDTEFPGTIGFEIH